MIAPTRLTLLGRGFDKALRLADFRSRIRTQRLCFFGKVVRWGKILCHEVNYPGHEIV